ncbi:tyrosine-type recombinase/integrase [Pantoea agglomerans]|uniref:tyrosine-type recombinase/integrase n=1 Tax=Enterobacter agglomerans TaxID=549 RepID=UPI0028A217D5|nr:tyrosine-type recombinase/integrase [Pantoea agglomerans]WNK54520.1 tyrosine-type recombinase/integrase [Pantoea agglomerans]
METCNLRKENLFFATMQGYSFKLSDTTWQLDKETCIFPYKIADKMPEPMRIGYLTTLAYFSAEYSAGYTKNINQVFSQWLGMIDIKTIDANAVYQFNVSLGPEKNYKLNSIKQFLTKWKKLGYVGVETSALTMLEKIKIKTNLTGEAVKRRDPNSGPLTEEELKIILESISKSLKENKMPMYLYCYVILLATTGRRPLQLTSLKAKDLIRTGEGWFLNIPKVKQRKDFRSEFSLVSIDDCLYEKLTTLVDVNQKHIEDSINQGIGHIKNELPIFMDSKKSISIQSGQSLDTIMATDFLHMKNSFISKELDKITTKFNIQSSRTHNPIRVNARRFRYTLGSRLAKEGASVEVIAKALDHKSINSSGIYVKNSPDNVHYIDMKLHSFFEPLSKIFQDSDSTQNKKLFTEYVLNSFGFTDCKHEHVECFTCKNFRAWSSE